MGATRKLVKVTNLGRLGYLQALNIQNRCAQHHLDKLAGRTTDPAENTLFIVEHDPVYTIGLRTQGYTMKDEEHLKSVGAEFYKTNRGGLITFHGPGQLVAYPVINMKTFTMGMRKYVCSLEKTVIGVCRQFGISAATTSDTGVWVEDRKIAAIGKYLNLQLC